VTDPFATTRWSVVLAAGHRSNPASQRALEELCATYWTPLYAYVRRRGVDVEEAQDLTQSFFMKLLEREALREVAQERGKFRAFLLACMKHHLADERERASAKKRGGGVAPLSLDWEQGEEKVRLQPADTETPESVFERQWALTVLEQVLGRLEREFEESERGKLFERLKVHLTGDGAGQSHREAAAALGMTEGAVKVAVHRMRRRYRDLLREEIGQTVAGPEQVDEELGHLLQALGG
jgi:RNA polymerase sigma-70 factor (ECF subfamily)